MRVERADIQSPEALQLIDALNAELTAAYSDTPGANHFRVDSSEVAPGQGTYVIAWRGETPIGCGAVRRLDAKTAEIKRMYVIPPERSAGVGRRIVLELESQARVLGVDRVVLETGTKQAVAIALYEKLGFERIPPFGEYVASAATSICMAKRLT